MCIVSVIPRVLVVVGMLIVLTIDIVPHVSKIVDVMIEGVGVVVSDVSVTLVGLVVADMPDRGYTTPMPLARLAPSDFETPTR